MQLHSFRGLQTNSDGNYSKNMLLCTAAMRGHAGRQGCCAYWLQLFVNRPLRCGELVIRGLPHLSAAASRRLSGSSRRIILLVCGKAPISHGRWPACSGGAEAAAGLAQSSCWRVEDGVSRVVQAHQRAAAVG